MQIGITGGTVRSWRYEDRDDIVYHANNRNVWINLRDRFPHQYKVSDARNWLDLVVGYEPETNFAIAVNDKAVGGIGFSRLDDVNFRSAEIGYWLGEEFWGRGLATQALVAVTRYAFESTDVCRVFAHVFEWNNASARVLEKAGYTFEGRLKKSVSKDGKIIDQLMYSMTI